ncbi:rifamycin-inactivating phosphotransferase [Solirubrobacter soli]|uniref:rifamycin-inactivating phosphotransferase n=1 Tax=Solirubrobacter soli TaxID=363832 RepID=UPI00055E8BF1|nr:rifamycin-inactivating phosphotransferase [Solirubrobacter soli]
MDRYVVALGDIDVTQVGVVGGKGANLGELSRIDGIRVPAGFCVTTRAFERIMCEASSIDELSRVSADDTQAIRTLSAEVRRSIEAVAIPDDVAAAIVEALDPGAAYAVRSSATAEDLPTASFAGQQDSYLNIAGSAAILEHVGRCWASLFTERAVTYRLHNGFDHRKVRMAVVVQEMVIPDVSGVIFTADPVTGNRKVATIEAVRGLGEALVSGLVNPEAALTGEQAARLVRLGRRIEAHFGRPQDIEWCLADDDFHFVQSRPITSLFPIPDAGDERNHVYISVGHQQMMTDPMKPLGLSVHQLVAIPRMYEAAGRLFVDIAPRLASPATRAATLEALGKDPLIKDALQQILDRGDFIASTPDELPKTPPRGVAPTPIETDPAIVAQLIDRNQASVAALQRDIRQQSGAALFDFILTDIQELKRLLSDPVSVQVIMAGIEATWWLNDKLEAWLGDKNAADALTQSAPGNVTSEMGLALLDVADAIRPYPEVVDFLRHVQGDDFLDELSEIPGGPGARAAVQAYLDTYGMRCAGEIDITRARWSERPSTLVPIILGNIEQFEPGAGERRFEQGRERARESERDVLERLQALPEGEHKADEVKRMIDRVRTFIGYREYPKYGMVRRYFIYKQALLAEAGRMPLDDPTDVFYLTFQEFQEAVRADHVDRRLIAERKRNHATYRTLTPPRVLTSDGEAVTGTYKRGHAPAGALLGVPVSGGTVEGRARVIHDMADADLEPGDILVTAYTDPSWTPLFVAITGLVTEVGGLMTHGAVIAREYGLPAVVGVEQATRLIRDGQRIRVHGTDGYVEILSEDRRDDTAGSGAPPATRQA